MSRKVIFKLNSKVGFFFCFSCFNFLANLISIFEKSAYDNGEFVLEMWKCLFQELFSSYKWQFLMCSFFVFLGAHCNSYLSSLKSQLSIKKYIYIFLLLKLPKKTAWSSHQMKRCMNFNPLQKYTFKLKVIIYFYSEVQPSISNDVRKC